MIISLTGDTDQVSRTKVLFLLSDLAVIKDFITCDPELPDPAYHIGEKRNHFKAGNERGRIVFQEQEGMEKLAGKKQPLLERDMDENV
jgi:hypothetical protein